MLPTSTSQTLATAKRSSSLDGLPPRVRPPRHALPRRDAPRRSRRLHRFRRADRREMRCREAEGGRCEGHQRGEMLRQVDRAEHLGGPGVSGEGGHEVPNDGGVVSRRRVGVRRRVTSTRSRRSWTSSWPTSSMRFRRAPRRRRAPCRRRRVRRDRRSPSARTSAPRWGSARRDRRATPVRASASGRRFPAATCPPVLPAPSARPASARRA
jgi:hypothetical protein